MREFITPESVSSQTEKNLAFTLHGGNWQEHFSTSTLNPTSQVSLIV